MKNIFKNSFLTENSIIKLTEYFRNIGKGSIIEYSDIQRNINQPMLVEDTIEKLLLSCVIEKIDSDYEDMNDVENNIQNFRLLIDYRGTQVIERKKEPNFNHSVDILRVLNKLKENYNIDNQEKIDNLILNFRNEANNILS